MRDFLESGQAAQSESVQALTCNSYVALKKINPVLDNFFLSVKPYELHVNEAAQAFP